MDAQQREAFLKKQILLQVGDRGLDPQYHLDFPMAITGGLWRISFVGHWTALMPHPASADDVRDALAAIDPIGNPNYVEVIGSDGGPYVIYLRDILGSQPLPMAQYPMVAEGSSLVPPSSLPITQSQIGKSCRLVSTCDDWWSEYSYVGNLELRSLYVKRKLFQILLGEAQKNIDTEVGDRKEKASQQFAMLTRLNADNQKELDGMAGPNASQINPAGQLVTGRIAKRTPNGLPYGSMQRCDDGGWR